MIAPDEPRVALLSIGSLRHVDTQQRTTGWTSGTHPPTGREAGGPRPFERIVPWPPVPGVPATIVWNHTITTIRSTRTSIVIAAWAAIPEHSQWTTTGTTVLYDDTPRLIAPTPEAAHAIATAAATTPAHARRHNGLFTANGTTLLAGTDPIGHGATPADTAHIAELLAAHPAADMLGGGIAVAADPTVGGYQLDPTWQMRHGPEPWTARVERAALNAGALIDIHGTEHHWHWTGIYRHINCQASWNGTHLTVHVETRPLTVAHPDIQGPLAALGAAMDRIDAIGDNDLMHLALNRSP